MKLVMIDFDPQKNPSGTDLPFLGVGFSNNGGLTCTLLRALRSSEQIKDNLHSIHVDIFIPFYYRSEYYCLPPPESQHKMIK